MTHTVVEVVSPSNAATGPVPAIVVRLRGEDGGWQQIIAAAGTVSELPVVVDEAGTVATVKVDPATLVGKHSG